MRTYNFGNLSWHFASGSFLNKKSPCQKIPAIKSVLIIGSGPIIIGQACEFDYAGSQAALSLKEEGISVSIINSNPATIMTDKVIADHVYLLAPNQRKHRKDT